MLELGAIALIIHALFACAVSVAHAEDAVSTFPSAREYEPCVVKAPWLPGLDSKPTDRLVAYRRTQNSWELIPYQIDERQAGHNITQDVLNHCPVNPGDTLPPNCSDVYALQHPATGYAGADGVLNSADEVVVMASDLGDRASGDAGYPIASPGFESSYYEIAVTDPISGGVGYFYIFVHLPGAYSQSARSYVSYGNFPANDAACAGSVSTPKESCGTFTGSPSDVSLQP